MKVLIWKINVEMENEFRKYYVEGKTRKGAIGNLKNILYKDVRIINAKPVME